LTVAIDRSALPPISTTCLESVGLDPEHPETRAMMVRAQEGPGDRVTLMPCPACSGCGMVTPERRAELIERDAELVDSDELEEE
jgi:hypothetical protein